MNEKFYAVVVFKATHDKDFPNNMPTNCKTTLVDAHSYAAKQLHSDSTITRAFICNVIEVVERASPPITIRPAVERATDNTGREWPAERSESSEPSTTDRDYSHG
jgi:hypothetical protein